MGSMTEERIVLRLEEQLKEAYEQIGKQFYEDMKDAEMEGESYKELFANVKKMRTSIDEKTLTRQGKKRCERCQSIVPLESKFCNMCGEKLPEMVPVAAENGTPYIEKCSGCGTVLEEDALFCPNCGKKKA